MDFTDESFSRMMREMVRAEGESLLKTEEVWHSAVPASVDKAALAAIGGGLLPYTAPAAGKAAAGTFLAKAAKVAGLSLAAAAVVAAGVVTVTPSLREGVAALLTGEERPAAAAQSAAHRQVPGDYVIPSPGEDFALTEALDDERLIVRWFTSDSQELMVQVAGRLPAEISGREDAELVDLGGAVASYLEQGEQKLLELRDGNVVIQITCYRAEKDEVLAYGTLLAEANGIG